MRVYLDMCCLKRPFDDQAQPRIRLESEAVLALLGSSGQEVEFLRAAAHDLENQQNPLPVRAGRVRQWLEALPSMPLVDAELIRRTRELLALGFKNFDAIHLASAELGGADVFASCDDRLLAAASRHAAVLRVRVINPVILAKEILA
jgi:hypothetical protein